MSLNLNLSELTLKQWHITDEEVERMSAHMHCCCPNCEGDMSVGDHEAAGICSDCYWSAVDHH